MNMHVNTEAIKRTISNRHRKKGEESICYFNYSCDRRCFILLDCNPGDWIYPITVRCRPENIEKVSDVLLNWFNFCLS